MTATTVTPNVSSKIRFLSGTTMSMHSQGIFDMKYKQYFYDLS